MPTHLIERLLFEVSSRGGSQAIGFDWQTQASRFCHEALLPALDRRFERLCGPGESISVERLEFDLTAFSLEKAADWDDLLDDLLEKMEKAIAQHRLENATETALTARSGLFRKWLFFLETGQFPLAAAQLSRAEIEENALAETASSAAAARSLRSVLMENRTALARLVRQHEAAFLQKLAAAFCGRSVEKWAENAQSAAAVLTILGKGEAEFSAKKGVEKGSKKTFLTRAEKAAFRLLRADFSEKFWTAAWQILLEQPSRAGEETAVFDRLLNENGLFQPQPLAALAEAAKKAAAKGAAKTAELAAFFERSAGGLAPFSAPKKEVPLEPFSNQTEKVQPTKTEPFSTQKAAEKSTAEYVRGAGVVLLHPFLPAFFEKLGLSKKGVFGSEKARSRAVHLVFYLATGEKGAMEHELGLCKLLCAWPVGEPLFAAPVLSKKTKTEAEGLLRAVIGHWKMLKSSSPEGLREGFLRREGKLERTAENGWRLRVEQSSLDVLLEQFPWGFGFFKLPWMREFLTVEWV